MVLRIGKREIDFLFFKKDADGITIISLGSELISYFNVRQTLEKIFIQLPQKENVHELIATFQASDFRAQLIQQTLAPSSSSHLIDKAEALLIEREIGARTERAFQKILFQESGILPSEVSLQKMKILERRIDGYSVPKLNGFKRGEIHFSILGVFLLKSSFLPVEQFAKAHKIWNVNIMHIAEALESFVKRRNQKGIYLCVEEEKTQIAVQNADHFVFPGALSMGADNFTEFFADLLGMRESTAEVFQEQYFRDALSLLVREKVQTYLLPEIRKFDTLLKTKLLETKMVLPGSLRIFGRGRALRDLSNLFAEDEIEGLPFSEKPAMSFLLPQDVWEVKTFSASQDPLYTALCLLGASFIGTTQ